MASIIYKGAISGGVGSGTNYTVIDQNDLDVDNNISLSPGSYLYVGNQGANFDLSGLDDGDRIEIINHSSYNCYLFGFNNWLWDGTSSTLSSGQGLIVEGAGLIAAKYNNNLHLFNTIPGGLAQGYREGLSSLGYGYWRVDWNNILTEIAFYYSDAPNTMVILNGANIISFSPSSTYSSPWPWQYVAAVLNNGNFGDNYSGSVPGTSSVVIVTPTNTTVSALQLGTQSGSINLPTVVSLYQGTSESDWTLYKTWNSPDVPGKILV